MATDYSHTYHPNPSDPSREDSSSPAKTQWEPLPDAPHRKGNFLWPSLGILCLVAVAVLGALFLPRFRLQPSTGTLASIDRGQVLIDEDGAGRFAQASVRQTVREGAVLQTTPGTVAMIEFASGAQMRIESEGEWQILMLRSSSNNRRSQTALRQLVGAASYVSRPPQPGVSAGLAVSTAPVTLRLVGVASVATSANGAGTINLFDGEGVVSAWGEEHRLTSPSVVTIDPESEILSVR